MQYWWVNQGRTYQQERDGGYVWAPQTSKAGNTLAHHSNVYEMKPRDRVVHYSEGQVRSFGVVSEQPVLASRPSELPGDLWEDNGFYAKIVYRDLSSPIPLRDIPVDYRIPENGPFNVMGLVNQGYMYQLSPVVMDFLTNLDHVFKNGQSIPSSPNEERWNEFIEWARLITEDWNAFEEAEIAYKREISQKLWDAKHAFSSKIPGWQMSLKDAFKPPNNLTPWQSHSRFLSLIDKDPETLDDALSAIWNSKNSGSDPADDIANMDGFIRALSRDTVQVKDLNMLEVIGSFLLMAFDNHGYGRYPIYRASPINAAYVLTDEPSPERSATPLDRYSKAMAFMDKVQQEGVKRKVVLRDRVDVQSVIWSITKGTPLEYWDEETKRAFLQYRGGLQAPDETDSDQGYSIPGFDKIPPLIANAGLKIDDRTIRRFHSSIWSKGFVILSGISGTGKTSLAQVYAEAVGGAQLLVPVAPNWTTNEDLLGYQNPLRDEFQHTSFSRFLMQASEAWHAADAANREPRPYFLILDEMNLARVEYYFALFLSKLEEMHRVGPTDIDLGKQKFNLTPNLKVVGTVNVDETTQMFSDKVYDRSQLIELPVSRNEIESLVSMKPYKDDLLKIWDAVRPTAPFAYRVVSEISGYCDQAISIGTPSEEAFDEQLLQKVLPKIKGMEQRVRESLEKIVDITADKYTLTHEKANLMLTTYVQNGFTSYFA